MVVKNLFPIYFEVPWPAPQRQFDTIPFLPNYLTPVDPFRGQITFEHREHPAYPFKIVKWIGFVGWLLLVSEDAD